MSGIGFLASKKEFTTTFTTSYVTTFNTSNSTTTTFSTSRSTTTTFSTSRSTTTTFSTSRSTSYTSVTNYQRTIYTTSWIIYNNIQNNIWWQGTLIRNAGGAPLTYYTYGGKAYRRSNNYVNQGGVQYYSMRQEDNKSRTTYFNTSRSTTTNFNTSRSTTTTFNTSRSTTTTVSTSNTTSKSTTRTTSFYE